MVFFAAELLTHGHFLDGLPAALLAVRPGGRHGELPLVIALQVGRYLEPSSGQLTQPALVWLYRLGTEASGLPIEEQHLQIFFEEGFIVEAAVRHLRPLGQVKVMCFRFGIQLTS